ncbi:MAG: CBS domain-containing protein, partial [Methanolinea sp.]
SLVVVRYGTPVAIVTERDLLSNVFAAGRDPSDVLVEDVMSYPLIRICPDLEIREAARTMIRKKGRLTVFSCGELCGIITASDLIREMPEAKETSMNVNDFMTKDVVYVPEDEKISEVVRIMGTERIGSVLVTSDGNPKGIFTERDLLTTLLARGAALDIPVGDVARSPLITAPAGISIHKAAQIMAQNHIKRLPLVRRKRIAGIVTARDLVEAYAR